MKFSEPLKVVKRRKLIRFHRLKIIEVISAVFIFLFVYTSISKLLNFASFKFILGKSPLIGGLASILAVILPAIELLVSVLLFIPSTRKWGISSSFALMMIFTVYIGYMLAFSPDRPCACGGVIKNLTWTEHLIFNVVFTAIAFVGIQIFRKKSENDQDLQEVKSVFT